MILSKLKTYGLVIVGALLGVATIALRVLLSQNSKLRRDVETKSANLKHARKVLDADINISEQEDIRLKEAKDEIRKGDAPGALTDPERLWRDED